MKTSRLHCWGGYREVSGHTGPKVPSRISEAKEQGSGADAQTEKERSYCG